MPISEPKIAIHTRFDNNDPDTVNIAMKIGDIVKRCNGHPISLIFTEYREEIAKLLSEVDGIIFTGTSDYWQESVDSNGKKEVRRTGTWTEIDRKVMYEVASQKLPVFAIGGAMQMLNEVLGGSTKKVDDDRMHEDKHEPLQHRHVINVMPGSQLDHAYGPGEVRVVSEHRFAIGKLAPLLQVSATATDAEIEGVESVDPHWLVEGTQFRPDVPTAPELDFQVFETFVNQIANPDTGEIENVSLKKESIHTGV